MDIRCHCGKTATHFLFVRGCWGSQELKNIIFLCRACWVKGKKRNRGRGRLYGDMSLREIGDKLGVSHTAVWYYLRGANMLSPEMRGRIDAFVRGKS